MTFTEIIADMEAAGFQLLKLGQCGDRAPGKWSAGIGDLRSAYGYALASTPEDALAGALAQAKSERERLRTFFASAPPPVRVSAVPRPRITLEMLKLAVPR